MPQAIQRYGGVCAVCGGAFRTSNNTYTVCSIKCGTERREQGRYDREARDGSLRFDGSGGCWTWTRNLSRGGYGPYRRYYVRLKGPIPKGLHIDHLCRNRACCNPLHMEAVTQRENSLRGVGSPAVNARKTHCDHGHEFTVENTYVNRLGWRWCRECKRIYWRLLRKARARAA